MSPVIVFKDGQELEEHPSIKAAAEWLSSYTDQDHRSSHSIIEKGVHLGESWEWSGETFHFTTDESRRREKMRRWKEEGRIKQEKTLPTEYWTFFCNPNIWAVDDFLRDGRETDSFSVTSWQKDWFEVGQYGVIRVGQDSRTKARLQGKERLQKGVYAIVQIIGRPEYRSAIDEYYYVEDEKKRYHVPIRYLHVSLDDPFLLVDQEVGPEEYDSHLYEGFQASSMPLNPAMFHSILAHWGLSEENVAPDRPDVRLPEELDEHVPYVEGAKRSITVNAYERNPKAREACLIKHGCRCTVCQFDFEERYGALGKGFIHVHHLRALHTIGDDYVVDPEHDLVPVCPNCHAMLHRRFPPYTVQELQSILSR